MIQCYQHGQHLSTVFLAFSGGRDDATGKDKTICVVDSGIAFNSPFPAVLRPERKVELILSFDFSQRDGDKALPFQVSPYTIASLAHTPILVTFSSRIMNDNFKMYGPIESEIENRYFVVAMRFDNQPRWSRFQTIYKKLPGSARQSIMFSIEITRVVYTIGISSLSHNCFIIHRNF